MKLRSSLINFAIIAFALSPLAFLSIEWHRLPELVPVHYNIHFTPDKIGKKNMLWLSTGTLSLVSVIVYFLLTNLHRIDPKRRMQPPSPSFKRIATVAVVFITALNFLLLLAVNNTIILSQKWLFTLLGLMMAFTGNYMINLKPNYFAGIRLPWTLSSDYNWKKTHQFAGKLWFWAGLLAIIITLLLPNDFSEQAFFALLGIMIIVPIVYSYRLFKKEKINTRQL